jgi:hypothetical protein
MVWLEAGLPMARAMTMTPVSVRQRVQADI